jgi:hypothetical protein
MVLPDWVTFPTEIEIPKSAVKIRSLKEEVLDALSTSVVHIWKHRTDPNKYICMTMPLIINFSNSPCKINSYIILSDFTTKRFEYIRRVASLIDVIEKQYEAIDNPLNRLLYKCPSLEYHHGEIYTLKNADILRKIYGDEIDIYVCGKSVQATFPKDNIIRDTITTDKNGAQIISFQEEDVSGSVTEDGAVTITQCKIDTKIYKLIGYKIARHEKYECLVTLGIPHNSRVNRYDADGKMRCERCKVIDISAIIPVEKDSAEMMLDSTITQEATTSVFTSNKVTYRVGEEIFISDFDPKPDAVCSRGIHFYLNSKKVLANYCTHKIIVNKKNKMYSLTLSVEAPPHETPRMTSPEPRPSLDIEPPETFSPEGFEDQETCEQEILIRKNELRRRNVKQIRRGVMYVHASHDIEALDLNTPAKLMYYKKMN